MIGVLGDAVVAGKIRLEDIEDRTHIEFIQDYVAQVAQGGVETRQDERLAGTHRSVVLFREIWKREINAMLRGEPLKQWKLISVIEPTAVL